MTGTRVDSFEKWMRDVEKRLARLERAAPPAATAAVAEPPADAG